MSASLSRRGFLGILPALPLGVSPQSPPASVHPRFPAQDNEAIKETVAVSHGNLARVKELVTARPALARASWDWGYGDWETAIDAASHVGNKPIAEFLLANGARPTIFTSAMLGQLSIVKAWIDATPGYQRTRGPHGLTLVAHARAGGAEAVQVLKYLESLGDADPQYPNLPLSAAEEAAIAGDYRFGPQPDDRLTVVKGPRGFTIQRPGHAERNLFHHGGLVFNPSGAESVRIRFAGVTLTVTDGPTTLTATRV